MNAGAVRMLLRPARGDAATVIIPAAAFAIISALVLIVVGGAQSFWSWSDAQASVYQMLAAIALVLLVVPLASLAGAAARLSARRRDERLSTLRLLGVTPTGVGVLTVIESTLIAAAGVVVGALAHLPVIPLVGLIPFRGEPLGAAAVLLPAWGIAVICLAAVALAAVSAVIGLRRVSISPLGVRMRARPAGAHWSRAIIAVVLLAAAFLLAQAAPAIAGYISATVVVAVLFAGALTLLNVIGPWALKVGARVQLRSASRPEHLLAARTVLDDPKAAWRQVGGIAMASFMAVFAGTGVALMNTMGAGASPEDAALVTDIRTGLIITLIGSFLMVAASVGVTQASDALDQRSLHRSLHRMGVPLRTVEAARRRALMSPLLLTALGSAATAVIVVFPLIGIPLIIDPLSLLTIAAVLAVGILLVWLGALATRPIVSRAFA